jgi:predicted ester cyclase
MAALIQEAPMMIEENKALVRRFIDDVLNEGNTAAITDYCVPGSMFAGGLEGQVRAMKTAFPDNHLTVEEIVAEGKRVVARVTTRGTNSGPLVGLPAFGRLETPVPPSGKKVVFNGVYILTISEGRITSVAVEMDQIGLLRQLGWTFTPPDS